MMPFLHAPFLAKDVDASMQRHSERYHAMQEFWPKLEKMTVHQQNRNRALFAKVAAELGYNNPIETGHDTLMTILHGFDAYGSIFTCDEGVARTQIGELIAADYDDREALTRFLEGLDVVTYEFESIPVSTVRFAAERVTVFPPIEALETAQDRLLEKTLFKELGIPTPDFATVDSLEDLRSAVARIGLPVVLKRRLHG